MLPYRLFLLQRLQDAMRACPAHAAQGLQATLARTGLAPLEVWGPPV